MFPVCFYTHYLVKTHTHIHSNETFNDLYQVTTSLPIYNLLHSEANKNMFELCPLRRKSHRMANQHWKEIKSHSVCFEKFHTFCLSTHHQAGICRDHSCWVTYQTEGYSGCMRLGPSSGLLMSPCFLESRVTFTCNFKNSYNTQCKILGKHNSPQIATEPPHEITHMVMDWSRGSREQELFSSKTPMQCSWYVEGGSCYFSHGYKKTCDSWVQTFFCIYDYDTWLDIVET